MRLVYLGSPTVAVAPLHALLDAGHDVELVVSNPDRRRGRGSELMATPVKEAALERGLAVSDDPAAALEVEADLGVVVAFGQIIRPHILDQLPMVNLHFSLLPRWRGAAPVQRAILAGDTVTGVCVMQVEAGLDTGGVFARVKTPIEDDTTAAALSARLGDLGAALLIETLSRPLGEPQPQGDHGVTYAAKITQEDLRIDWSRPVAHAHRQVKVGGAWTTFRNRRLKVLDAAPVSAEHDGSLRELSAGELSHDDAGCGGDRLRLLSVQPEGKGPIDVRDWLRGVRPGPGERFE